jgi:type I restriction-modification system DNA methylase subunit
MLNPELKKNIDEKWDACWPMSLLKPVAILDLISYLFFLKKISENHPAGEKSVNNLDNGFFNSTETGEMESGIIKEMEDESMQTLFNPKKGSIDLVKNYSRSLVFGAFVKGGLLVTPTQKLLANAVGIMKIIEDEAAGKKGKIFEYLLNKKELNGPDGQAYLPEYLVNLIVSIIQPTEKDCILDPSAGDGSLLVASAKYILGNNSTLNDADPRKFVGLESDLTSLRIAGMNMILNGINAPELKSADIFPGVGSVTIEPPTVIVANLIFSAVESRMVVEGTSLKETTRKEISFLKFIIKNAAQGSRIAVIVPDNILYNNSTEFVAIRQDIMDRFKLEAVISLDDKTVSQFFGTSILIFYKKAPAIADRVWFYKVEHCKETGKNENPGSETKPQDDTIEIGKQRDELEEILNHFNNKDNDDERKHTDSFYIDARVIRAKNYGLSYNEYCLLIDQENLIHRSEITSDEKKVAIANLKNNSYFPVAEKLPEPKKSYVKKIIVLTCVSIVVLGIGFGAYWFLYLKKSLLTPKKQDSIPVVVLDSVNRVTTTSAATDTTSNQTSEPTANPVQSINKSKIVAVQVSATGVATRYSVTSDRAYFYNSADSNARREVYINNLVHAVLTPEKEKNGFIYVVYTNKRGESTKGWLNKSDLTPLP